MHDSAHATGADPRASAPLGHVYSADVWSLSTARNAVESHDDDDWDPDDGLGLRIPRHSSTALPPCLPPMDESDELNIDPEYLLDAPESTDSPITAALELGFRDVNVEDHPDLDENENELFNDEATQTLVNKLRTERMRRSHQLVFRTARLRRRDRHLKGPCSGRELDEGIDAGQEQRVERGESSKEKRRKHKHRSRKPEREEAGQFPRVPRRPMPPQSDSTPAAGPAYSNQQQNQRENASAIISNAIIHHDTATAEGKAEGGSSV